MIKKQHQNEMKKDAESWPPLSYSGSWRNESIDTVFITTAMGMWFHDYPRNARKVEAIAQIKNLEIE